MPNIVKNRVHIRVTEQYEAIELEEWLDTLYDVYKYRITTRDMILPTPLDEGMVIPIQIDPSNNSADMSEATGKAMWAGRLATSAGDGDSVVVLKVTCDISDLGSPSSYFRINIRHRHTCLVPGPNRAWTRSSMA
jgi:hypothetical protein